MRLPCLEEGSTHKGEQAESKTLGKKDTSHRAMEIHLRSPLNAFQEFHSRLAAKKCLLIQ